jgi:hypothetical protein
MIALILITICALVVSGCASDPKRYPILRPIDPVTEETINVRP